MQSLPEPYNTLNETYALESGLGSKPFLVKEYIWQVWLSHGFTKEDLIRTCRYLRKQVNLGKRRPNCLSFRNLVERPDIFENDCELSKNDQLRNPPPSAKALFLKSIKREEVDKPVTRMANEVVAGLLQQLRKGMV